MDDKRKSIEAYIQSKIMEYLNKSSEFYKKIQSSQAIIENVDASIRNLKREKGDEGFEQAKQQLITLQEVHYNMFLLDQSVKQIQFGIHELSLIAQIFDIDIPLEDDRKEFYNVVSKTNPHIFEIEKGEVVMVKNEMTSVLTNAMNKKLHTDESLMKIYANF
jgi:hypothetical protein